jgi:hypothetical protein
VDICGDKSSRYESLGIYSETSSTGSKMSSRDETFGFRGRGHGMKHHDDSHTNVSRHAHFDIQMRKIPRGLLFSVMNKTTETGSTDMADVDGRTPSVYILVLVMNYKGSID